MWGARGGRSHALWLAPVRHCFAQKRDRLGLIVLAATAIPPRRNEAPTPQLWRTKQLTSPVVGIASCMLVISAAIRARGQVLLPLRIASPSAIYALRTKRRACPAHPSHPHGAAVAPFKRSALLALPTCSTLPAPPAPEDPCTAIRHTPAPLCTAPAPSPRAAGRAPV